MTPNEWRAPVTGAFPSSDHFSLGQRYGGVDRLPEPPSPVRPFGLTVAVSPRTVTTVNRTQINYDEENQIGVLDDGGVPVPLSKHTDGTTNTVTDGGDGHGSNRDSDSDHRED
jgi:putative ATP-grasp target RiPP